MSLTLQPKNRLDLVRERLDHQVRQAERHHQSKAPHPAPPRPTSTADTRPRVRRVRSTRRGPLGLSRRDWIWLGFFGAIILGSGGYLAAQINALTPEPLPFDPAIHGRQGLENIVIPPSYARPEEP